MPDMVRRLIARRLRRLANRLDPVVTKPVLPTGYYTTSYNLPTQYWVGGHKDA